MKHPQPKPKARAAPVKRPVPHATTVTPTSAATGPAPYRITSFTVSVPRGGSNVLLGRFLSEAGARAWMTKNPDLSKGGSVILCGPDTIVRDINA